MDVKVPIAKAISVGMRKLSAVDSVERALKILHGKARVKRTMWSRRAQEYDAKINSGDLICIAEVVRDLFVQIYSLNNLIPSVNSISLHLKGWPVRLPLLIVFLKQRLSIS